MSSVPRTLMGLAALCALAGCSQQIQHGLDEKSANDLQTVLISSGLSAEKVAEAGKKPTWAIEVPEESAADAVRVLSQLGLPKVKGGGCEGGTSLVPSPEEERSCQTQALAAALEQTLERSDGVLTARVHLALPAPVRPGQVQPPATAATLLRAMPGRGDRVRRAAEELRQLVAASVPGLAAPNVTVVVQDVYLDAPAMPVGAKAAPSRMRLLGALPRGARRRARHERRRAGDPDESLPRSDRPGPPERGDQADAGHHHPAFAQGRLRFAMDSTRVEAGRARKAAAVVPGTAIHDDAYELAVASFTAAFAKEEARALLEGLVEGRRERALAHAEELLALDSATRQSRLARLFGTQRGADGSLRALMVEAGPKLRAEIFRRLPPYHRSLFPAFRPASPGGAPDPGLVRYAERLIKEAVR